MIDKELVEQWVNAVADPDKVPPYQNELWTLTTEEMQAFAQKAATHGAEAMRERCAAICDEYDGSWYVYRKGVQVCAAAIRSLK